MLVMVEIGYMLVCGKYVQCARSMCECGSETAPLSRGGQRPIISSPDKEALISGRQQSSGLQRIFPAIGSFPDKLHWYDARPMYVVPKAASRGMPGDLSQAYATLMFGDHGLSSNPCLCDDWCVRSGSDLSRREWSVAPKLGGKPSGIGWCVSNKAQREVLG